MRIARRPAPSLLAALGAALALWISRPPAATAQAPMSASPRTPGGVHTRPFRPAPEGRRLDSLPVDARIRVTLRGPEADGPREALLRTSDAGVLRFRAVGASEIESVPWEQVARLEVSDGVQRTPVLAHLGTVAATTAIGTVAGWSTWHTCNDPDDAEDEGLTWSCVLMPQRLGTATRAGAWLGVGAGLIGSLLNLRRERWAPVGLDTPAPGLVLRPAGGGLGVGWSVRF